jgi:hypothetical protein
MPTDPVEPGREVRPRILRGVVFSLLAIGQLVFALVFAYRFYIISQSERMSLDSRWILPPIAVVSLLAFAHEAWRAFRPKRNPTPNIQ